MAEDTFDDGIDRMLALGEQGRAAWLAAHDREVRAQALRDAAAFIDRERQRDLTDMTRITGLREYWQNVAVGKERCVIVLRDLADAEERGE